jgi:hypothetical protein
VSGTLGIVLQTGLAYEGKVPDTFFVQSRLALPKIILWYHKLTRLGRGATGLSPAYPGKKSVGILDHVCRDVMIGQLSVVFANGAEDVQNDGRTVDSHRSMRGVGRD